MKYTGIEHIKATVEGNLKLALKMPPCIQLKVIADDGSEEPAVIPLQENPLNADFRDMLLRVFKMFNVREYVAVLPTDWAASNIGSFMVKNPTASGMRVGILVLYSTPKKTDTWLYDLGPVGHKMNFEGKSSNWYHVDTSEYMELGYIAGLLAKNEEEELEDVEVSDEIREAILQCAKKKHGK